MTVLIDTSVLIALTSRKDKSHVSVRELMRETTEARIIAAPVLPELFYMLASTVNYQSAISVFTQLQSAAYRIVALTRPDMVRMREIMNQYQDAEFDFVDVSIMALAERLNITTVYTLDHRDFSIFRPRHSEFLTLLP